MGRLLQDYSTTKFYPLCSTNMEDLREKTHTEHYEIFRRRRLQEMGFADTGEDNRPVRYAEWPVARPLVHVTCGNLVIGGVVTHNA